MKIDPQDFDPQVWEANYSGQPVRILVCGKRYVHTPFTGEDRKTCDKLGHPIAILVSIPAIVIPAFTDDCHEWKVSQPCEHGITSSNAQRALAQAWRMVEGITSPSWPTKEFHFKFKASIGIHTDLDALKQDMTMLRNVTLCLWWDSWKKRGLTAKQKAQELSAAGIPTEEGKLTKAAENLGVW